MSPLHGSDRACCRATMRWQPHHVSLVLGELGDKVLFKQGDCGPYMPRVSAGRDSQCTAVALVRPIRRALSTWA